MANRLRLVIIVQHMIDWSDLRQVTQYGRVGALDGERVLVLPYKCEQKEHEHFPLRTRSGQK
jgi:hypothetical protein